MKKLVLAAVVAFSSLTFAQQFGLKGGVNISSISKDGYDDTKSKVGFEGGAFLNIPVASTFSIQPEILYSQLGAKVNQTNTSTLLGTTYTTKSSSSLNLDYITVPVMFQFRATPAFYLEAGPEFGFLTSAKAKNFNSTTTSNGTTTSSDSSSKDLKDYYSSFNMGVGLGLGYDITPNFGLSARYVAGFTDINKKDSNTNGNTSSQNNNNNNRNNTFQGGVYFKF